MAQRTVRELTIPKREGRAFEVLKGQTFRVISPEGKQVGDMTAFGRHDHREKFSTHLTCAVNGRSFSNVRTLYSGPPFYNLMMTVTDDKYGAHWVHGRCNPFYNKIAHGGEGQRTCHGNIVESLGPYGFTEYDVPLDTFNIFMVGHFDDEERFNFSKPLIEAGDFIDFRAEMDVLVSISACPNEGLVNDFAPKPLNVEIRQG